MKEIDIKIREIKDGYLYEQKTINLVDEKLHKLPKFYKNYVNVLKKGISFLKDELKEAKQKRKIKY